MSKNTINICQVSLDNNIPLIIENFENFKKIYGEIKVFILCPKKELNDFKKNLHFKEIEIIDEEEILSFNEFEKIFEKLSKNINYKDLFKKRLTWYYQQILKISFALNFTQKNSENLIIWDADTIILKKIEFSLIILGALETKLFPIIMGYFSAKVLIISFLNFIFFPKSY